MIQLEWPRWFPSFGKEGKNDNEGDGGDLEVGGGLLGAVDHQSESGFLQPVHQGLDYLVITGDEVETTLVMGEVCSALSNLFFSVRQLL